MPRRRWASVQIPPETMPKEEIAHFDTFAGGFDSRDAQEDLPNGTSPEMRDMEVTPQDRLIRAPGVTAIDAALTHQPKQIFLHAGPSFSSELLLIAAPYLGIYKGGAVTWQFSPDFLTGTYSFANYAGIALFSRGPGKLLFREAKGAIGVIDGAPGGFAVGVFAGRVILGGTEFADSDVDLMRVVWNDSTGDYKSWNPDDGSADQVLIGSSRARADRIQAFAYIGYNTLAVICRRSIWIGQPTGDVFQPINFEPRLEDTGCSYAQTVITTEFGVLFLSDDGVRLFDGNAAQVISDAVNQQLLPTLDADGRYSASFDPARKRYYLHTPVGTWVLDMLKRRWFRWCTAFRCSAFFPTQGADTGRTWGTAIGTWGQQTGAWWQLGTAELGSGMMHFVRLYGLGFEDPSNSQAFGVDLIPSWRSPRKTQDNQDRLITHTGVRLTYEADAASQIEVQLPAMGSGDYEPVKTADLSFGASLKGTRTAFIPFVHAGRGLGFGVRVVSGNPRLRHASVSYQDNGEQLGPVADIVFDECPALPPDDPADAIPVSIVITPVVESLAANIDTAVLTAIVRNSDGEIISAPALVWETDDVTKCTVASSGPTTAVVTAHLVVGTTAIRARIVSPVAIVSNDSTITVHDEYVIHSFGPGSPYVFSADFAVTTVGDGVVRALLVAGGASGGSVDGSGVASGGGGAGGLIDNPAVAVTAGSHLIDIGEGGLHSTVDHTIGIGSASGNKGQNTTAFGLTALGGGVGHSHDATSTIACNGGSGGGVESTTEDIHGDGTVAGPFAGGTGIVGQGHDGGQSKSDPTGATNFYGGGGGGAGAAGSNYVTGNGGNGLQSDITGVLTYYAGGGGAGYMGSAAVGGIAGLGGGGNGGSGNPINHPTGFDGVNGTGGGGGGGGATLSSAGGDGGHGQVIVRYKRSSRMVATGGTITTVPV